jgi:hypothetical protein
MDASGSYIGWRTALAVLGRYALFGPLIGGAPYVWTIIGIPFAYMLGIGPALVCGVLTLWWLRLGGTRAGLPGPWHAAAFGALFGAVGTFITQMVIVMYGRKSFDVIDGIAGALYSIEGLPIKFILPHAVVAGAIMAAWTVRRLARPAPARDATAFPPSHNAALPSAS